MKIADLKEPFPWIAQSTGSLRGSASEPLFSRRS